jgi:hypothetical protein
MNETMMSREEPRALTAAGSAIHLLWSAEGANQESWARASGAWNFRRDEEPPKKLDFSYYYLPSIMVLNKRKGGYYFPSGCTVWSFKARHYWNDRSS